jgi:hypothetical protein
VVIDFDVSLQIDHLLNCYTPINAHIRTRTVLQRARLPPRRRPPAAPGTDALRAAASAASTAAAICSPFQAHNVAGIGGAAAGLDFAAGAVSGGAGTPPTAGSCREGWY